MLKLKSKYSIGVLVMFYEIDMFEEYIDGCIQACQEVSNKENLYFDFCFNVSQYFETIDTDKITKKQLIDKFKYTT